MLCGARLLVNVAVACAVAACSSPTAEQAEAEAVEMLDRIAAVAVGDLRPAASGGPDAVQQCSALPGAPTSKKAWEVWRRYDAQGGAADEAVGRLVAYAKERGGLVVFDTDDPRLGRYTRIEADGLDMFATSRPLLEIRVRSRCFRPPSGDFPPVAGRHP